MHISWDEIQTLEALVRTGSVEAAGHELSLRHSSVSRRIAALEGRLGTPLFVRGARLKPTELAARIAERAAPMRTAAIGIQSFVSAHQRGRESRLVITTNDVLAPLLFIALSDALPRQRVQVVVSDSELALAPGEVDLALRPSQDPSGTLRGRRVGRLRLGIYRAPSGATEWIVPSVSLRAKASMRWWRHVPQDAAGAVECNSLLAMREACGSGLGRALLPGILAGNDERLRLEQELDGGTPVWLLCPATRDVDRDFRAVRDALHKALRRVAGAWCD